MTMSQLQLQVSQLQVRLSWPGRSRTGLVELARRRRGRGAEGPRIDADGPSSAGSPARPDGGVAPGRRGRGAEGPAGVSCSVYAAAACPTAASPWARALQGPAGARRRNLRRRRGSSGRLCPGGSLAQSDRGGGGPRAPTRGASCAGRHRTVGDVSHPHTGVVPTDFAGGRPASVAPSRRLLQAAAPNSVQALLRGRVF